MKAIIGGMLLFLVNSAFGGQADSSMIKMVCQDESKISGFDDTLHFIEFNKYKVNFIGSSLRGKNYWFVKKEMWNGKITKNDTLFDSRTIDVLKPISNDTLSFDVFAQKISKKKLKLNVKFPDFQCELMLDATDSPWYYLVDIENGNSIELNKAFTAFVYMLPYEIDGRKEWCTVTGSDVPVENWGKEFNIKHYVLFEMMFF